MASEALPDVRYVYGSTCTWHGPIRDVRQTAPCTVKINGRTYGGVQIPACPYCGGPLMEWPSREKWDESAERFSREIAANMPRYLDWLESLHNGPCATVSNWDWRAAYEKWCEENPKV